MAAFPPRLAFHGLVVSCLPAKFLRGNGLADVVATGSQVKRRFLAHPLILSVSIPPIIFSVHFINDYCNTKVPPSTWHAGFVTVHSWLGILSSPL